MGSGLEPVLARADDLLFVTSSCFVGRWSTDVEIATALTNLRGLAGDRWVMFDRAPQSCYDAAPLVRDALKRHSEIKGVVILGDYSDVPPRRVFSIDPSLSKDLDAANKANAWNDNDDWWVWNDDIYGSTSVDYYPDYPVSRLPIVPRQSRDVVGNRPESAAPPPARGMRAAEFVFAHVIYHRHLGNPKVEVETSPPWPPDPSVGGSTSAAGMLDADNLYLALHNDGSVDFQFTGTPPDVGPVPLAIDRDLVDGHWVTNGVAFGAICWGALMSTRPARRVKPGMAIVPRTVDQSLPLTFIDHGANAFVGFTALHYVPEPPKDYEIPEDLSKFDLRIGGQLHADFWEIFKGGAVRPAEALGLAKEKFIGEMPTGGDHALARAKNLKAFWSATCIGFGW